MQKESATERQRLQRSGFWLSLHGLTAGSGRDGNGVLHLEVQEGLRLQNNLLAFVDGGDAGSSTCPGGCADSCALSATKDSTQNCACRCPPANLGRSALASSATGLGPAVGLKVVALAVHQQAR